MRMFGATSAGMLITLIASITKKNEISKVTPKKSAVPNIKPNSLTFSRLLGSEASRTNSLIETDLSDR
jgi:hypothetical protein